MTKPTREELIAACERLLSAKEFILEETDIALVATELKRLLQPGSECPSTFMDWFVQNYPGPHTIINDPKWHAPKIYRAAKYAMIQAADDGYCDSAFHDIHPGRCPTCSTGESK